MSESSPETSPDEPTYEYPDLTEHSEQSLRQMTTKSLHRLDHNMDRIARYLGRLAESSESTTPGSAPGEPPRQGSVANPPSEMPVSANNDVVTLADGRCVPTTVIRALDEYDITTWPGALLPEARAAVAHVVINVVEQGMEPVLRTSYPFCLDPNPSNAAYESPCILRADHTGKHHDNNDGVW
jgi:hypothetical protein